MQTREKDACRRRMQVTTAKSFTQRRLLLFMYDAFVTNRAEIRRVYMKAQFHVPFQLVSLCTKQTPRIICMICLNAA